MYQGEEVFQTIENEHNSVKEVEEKGGKKHKLTGFVLLLKSLKRRIFAESA